MATENAPKTAGRRFAMLQAVLQPGMSDNAAKFLETWKSLEHQVEIYEKSLLDKARMPSETARSFFGEFSTV